jgi:hypothetical protein
MNSILLILPYFGKWPVWFDAYLVSIEKNPTVNWLFITDCKTPETFPDNCHFVKTTLPELNLKVNDAVHAKVPLSPRKLCDIRPAYGEIFKEYLQDYDFWGFCDADVIWGNIRKFITTDVLNQYDIISSRKNTISGHFSLFRNTAALNSLYKDIPNYVQLFENDKLMRLDEEGFTEFLKENMLSYRLQNRIYWDSILLNQEKGFDSRQEYYLDRWMWKEGKMLEIKNKDVLNEVMYLHFINWKKSMKKCDINYTDSPGSFYISYTAIHYKLHSDFEKMINAFRNLFDGYYVRLWKKAKIKRWKKMKARLFKRIKW